MMKEPEPWTPNSGASAKGMRHAPAAVRNRDAILAVLREALPSSGLVLEIASGSGEHAIHFAAALPELNWQPTDFDPDALASIAARQVQAALPNLSAPLLLDAMAQEWPIAHADALLCINMIHISPWEATLGLLRGSGAVLRAGGLLYLYGPYIRSQIETAPSNLAFDASLKARDPDWGVRRLEDVVEAARMQGLVLDSIVEMPANNLSLLLRRR
ncbi:DUF938 domain-containing protein [Sphingobium baderi]|uniref:SAM-dependent methyltransferase n=1 Tax=Sphingobium baderi TaxID=1332080 RepID=A0A0S3EYQ8_9SPHN|nr:DUF938 domain-containing protein [Sphingobium baderi]ALR20508.1 SAM-dependent methyltransferase [Sphingobium baderi]